MDTTTQPGTTIPDNSTPDTGLPYKWVALSNTTIATFMATVNGSIILISLPAIFNGISINPLTSFQYLLWMLMGTGLSLPPSCSASAGFPTCTGECGSTISGLPYSPQGPSCSSSPRIPVMPVPSN
ncbi:MAG: hypothetical protein WC620_05510 [Methanoregula sp.]